MQGSWKIVAGIGGAMVALGVAAYVLTSFASVTALIPSFIGIVVAGLGLAAKPPRGGSGNRWFIVAAGGVGLLGIGGPAARLVPQITSGQFTLAPATISQLIFIALAAALVVVGGMAMMRKP